MPAPTPPAERGDERGREPMAVSPEPSIRSRSPSLPPGSHYIGIDLGTTLLRLCAYHPDLQTVRFVPNERDKRKTPCFVAFPDDIELVESGRKACDPVVGEEAQRWLFKYPKATVFSWAQLVGLKFDDERVAFYQRYAPYRLVKDKYARVCVEIEHDGRQKHYRPEDLTAILLTYARQNAEQALRHPITGSVITVPAGYTLLQRDATKEAARQAGFQHARLISNAAAAAIAFGFDRPAHPTSVTEYVLSFNLGAAHIDCAVVGIDEEVFEVLASAGDVGFGAADVDVRLLMHFVQDLSKQSNRKLTSLDLLSLRFGAEKIKTALSTADSISHTIHLSSGAYAMTMTRELLETLCADFFDRCLGPIQQVLVEAKMDISKISNVVLSGGGSHFPKLRDRISSLFPGNHIYDFALIDKHKAVGYGAGVESALLSGMRSPNITNYLLIDSLSFSLGILDTTTNTIKTLLKRNTALPAQTTVTLRPMPPTTPPTSTPPAPIAVVKLYEGDTTDPKTCHLLATLSTPLPTQDKHITLSIDVDVDRTVLVTLVSDETEKNVRVTDYPMPVFDVSEDWERGVGVTVVGAGERKGQTGGEVEGMEIQD
ncbi:hypothetical protein SpCBS45565_g03281 [Spizellomyces sp. 'palustris']|nr:hypothetical protein SpCBS45565_g03281 [Spizellomyces sp. 'palustris']